LDINLGIQGEKSFRFLFRRFQSVYKFIWALFTAVSRRGLINLAICMQNAHAEAKKPGPFPFPSNADCRLAVIVWCN